MPSSISFSTAQAARYLGVAPHVLTSNLQRHGNYLGIEPRKVSNGRLHWPAEAVREASIPPDWEQPEGGPLLLEVFKRLCPGIEERDAYRLVLFFLGSEALPGWKPVSGQTMASMPREDVAIAALILQATLDRYDWAVSQGGADNPEFAQFAAMMIKRLSYHAAPLVTERESK